MQVDERFMWECKAKRGNFISHLFHVVNFYESSGINQIHPMSTHWSSRETSDAMNKERVEHLWIYNRVLPMF